MDSRPARSECPAHDGREAAAGWGTEMARAKTWDGWLPGLQTLRAYELAWLRRDVLAGVVLAAFLVPVGVAYAAASGVPAINGLYATIAGLVAYAVFGPSRILVYGPDSALAAIILSTILPLSGGDPMRAVALAGAMALVSGVVCVAAGLVKLGFLTELLSKPIRYGYMNGIALAVMISQLPKLFDLKIESSGPLRDLWTIGQQVAAGEANQAATLLGAGTLVVLLAFKRFKRIPVVLIAVAGATVISAWLGLAANAGVKVLGEIPQGLPSPVIPLIGADDVVPVVIGGIACAIMAFADTSVLSRSYAARLGQKVDPNQEMVALGAVNLAAGLFQGFPQSSSSSRTPVAEAAGAKTQLTGVVGAAVVALLLVAAPRLLQDLPSAALAAVVIAAVIGLFEFADLGRIWRIQRWEFWLSVACTVGVLVFGAIQGIMIALAIAIAEFLWDGWRPPTAVLGRVDGKRGFHDVARYPEARLIPGLVLFRWSAPLFFANAELFNTEVQKAVAASPGPVKRIIVTAEPVTSIDVTANDALLELARSLRAQGIELCFAELKDRVKDKLARFGSLAELGESNFFETVGAAADAYLEAHAVAWTKDLPPASG
jgi:high affinity sulfate transporter 1